MNQIITRNTGYIQRRFSISERVRWAPNTVARNPQMWQSKRSDHNPAYTIVRQSFSAIAYRRGCKA